LRFLLAWEARTSCSLQVISSRLLDLLRLHTVKARRLGAVQAFVSLLFPCSGGFR
jgi:hypothetical protein